MVGLLRVVMVVVMVKDMTLAGVDGFPDRPRSPADTVAPQDWVCL